MLQWNILEPPYPRQIIRILLNKLNIWRHISLPITYCMHNSLWIISTVWQLKRYICLNRSLYSKIRMRRTRPHTLSTTVTSHVIAISWSIKRSQNGKMKNPAIIQEITKFDPQMAINAQREKSSNRKAKYTPNATSSRDDIYVTWTGSVHICKRRCILKKSLLTAFITR